MAKRFAAPKGTRDLLPPETAIWAEVEAVARRVFALYGYREIRTPLFEETELFARGVGETTDIVGKEMYSFTDKGGRSITLRPESTAAVCRAYVEHGMQQWPQPVRLFYIGPQFRYERPQKGRYRQFHQIGAELIGRPSGGSLAAADAEILAMLVRFLGELGFSDLKVLLNTVGDAASRAAYRAALVGFLTPLRDRLSEESRRRLETNPLRILDTKSPEEQELLREAPRLEASLTGESRRHFADVCARLDAAAIRYGVEDKLVRGLDYYTNTVFEIVAEGLGAQNAICGGGAYEGLIEELGGPPTYGVGFAIGEDRLIEVLPEPTRRRFRIPYVIVRGVAWENRIPTFAFEDQGLPRTLVDLLREKGIPVLGYEWKDSKRAFSMAEHLEARYVVMVGENEVSEDGAHIKEVVLRDTETRQEERMAVPELLERLRAESRGA